MFEQTNSKKETRKTVMKWIPGNKYKFKVSVVAHWQFFRYFQYLQDMAQG